MRWWLRLLVAGAVALLSGCGGENGGTDRDQPITEEALERSAAIAAEASLLEANVRVRGALECRSESQSPQERWEISCTGTTEDGRPVTVMGTVPTDQRISDGRITGSFKADVDGAPVLEESCLGATC